jgi:hypothetical protein
MIENVIQPIRLHLELKDGYLSDTQKRMLKRYGESKTGDSITRDILIPSDMPLHNLHYAIQKLFGWQNSHLRSFYLPEERYDALTERTVKGWSDLVGILFQPPSEAENDVFWDDDYESGSFKIWLKRKYIGPYVYGGWMENEGVAKQDIQKLLERYKTVEVKEKFADYWKRKEDENSERRVIKKAPLIDLTIEEMDTAICIEGGTESLLERLEVNKILAAQEESIDTDNLFPVTKELIYNYDFGDNWMITITKYKNCDDLIEENIISEYELEAAEKLVIDKYKPVCISKQGLSVLDDVGNLSGFADFLGVIYEGEDKKEASDFRAWARSLGWSAKKVSIKKMI